MIICIDPGHSGPAEPGAVYGGCTEARLALRIALIAGAHLADFGHDVIWTRTGDIESDLLGPRVTLANDAGADLFVSVHINAATIATARGLEVYHHPDSMAGAALAAAVHSRLVDLGCLPDRGIRTANFYVLRATNMPSILIECGFLSNVDDRTVLASAAWQAHIGQAISKGIHEQAKKLMLIETLC